MHVCLAVSGNIYIYIYIYAAFRHPRGVQDLFTVNSHPKSWCTLHQADIAMVQRHSTSMQRAVVPAQQP